MNGPLLTLPSLVTRAGFAAEPRVLALPAFSRASASIDSPATGRRSSVTPAPAVPRPTYRLRLARTAEDLRAAQFLRFLVFNVELSEGLERSYETCLDADQFDDVCDHLLVEDRETGELVGTYRLQTGAMAQLHHGYYSAQEFDFSPYESLRPSVLELGRACILAPHRSFAVLSLLWRGIAQYALERGARYLIGCSSLTTQDPAVGASAFRQLGAFLVDPALRTVPFESWRCPLEQESETEVKLPKLLTAYLNLGARICGAPALDKEFKTVDFLTLLDLSSVPARTAQRWFGIRAEGEGEGEALPQNL